MEIGSERAGDEPFPRRGCPGLLRKWHDSDALPYDFTEFDVLDTESGDFLDTPRRAEVLAKLPSIPNRLAGAAELFE